MFAIAVLIPTLIVGAIAWGVVGVFQQRGREPMTAATAASFYAHVMFVAGLVIGLAGLAVFVKVGLGYLAMAYSYGQPPDLAGPNPTTQRAEDVVLAATLLAVGLAVAAGHLALRRMVVGLEGGRPGWIVRGTVTAITAVTGLGAVLGTTMAGYQVLNYFVVQPLYKEPFGDAAGVAAIFLPIWLVALALLLRRVRPAQPRPAGPELATPPRAPGIPA